MEAKLESWRGLVKTLVVRDRMGAPSAAAPYRRASAAPLLLSMRRDSIVSNLRMRKAGPSLGRLGNLGFFVSVGAVHSRVLAAGFDRRTGMRGNAVPRTRNRIGGLHLPHAPLHDTRRTL